MQRILLLSTLALLGAADAHAEEFIRGDANNDSQLNIADPVFILGHIFQGAPGPDCGDAADANDDGALDISDAIALLSFLYGGGPAPAEPTFEPGYDPTPTDPWTCGDAPEFNDDSPDDDDFDACADGDGDGIPDTTTLDQNGRPYCLSVDAGPAVVGQDVAIRVTAYHADGMRKLALSSTAHGLTSVATMQSCLRTSAIPLTCTTTFHVPLEFAGAQGVSIHLWRVPNHWAGEREITIDARCDPSDTGCADRDERIDDFLDWMDDQGYHSCFVDTYASYFDSPQAHAELIPFIADRNPQNRLSRSTVIDFIDVIPTDPGAEFAGLDEGEAQDCHPNAMWPGWCEEGRSADYTFIEEHLSRTLGVDVTLNYQRLEISYADTLGEPILSRGRYRFPSTYAFQSAFDPHSIVHYAIQSYENTPIWDMTGASHVASVSLEPYNSLGMVAYTHELGHTYRLPHAFIDQERRRVQLQIDGIMTNTYFGHTEGFIDPLDPLERYALEPDDGYIDQDTFVAEYNQRILASGVRLDACN